MEKLKNSGHMLCANCRKIEKPVIEVMKMVKGKSDVADLIYNKVIFIMEGSIILSLKNGTSYCTVKGKMLFLLAGSRCSYQAMEKSTIILFRVQTPINLCKNISLEELYVKVNKKRKEEYRPGNGSFGELEITAPIEQFLERISQLAQEGLKCHYWFEIKVKEFFLLLRIYYTKEEIYEFLVLILSNDIAFSEQIRMHWSRFQTVGELAAFMNLTTKRFTARFTSVFGQTPYKWILQARARIIHAEITSTGKQFKQIAMENGFASESSFTRFCRKEFNKTPTSIREEKIIFGEQT